MVDTIYLLHGECVQSLADAAGWHIKGVQQGQQLCGGLSSRMRRKLRQVMLQLFFGTSRVLVARDFSAICTTSSRCFVGGLAMFLLARAGIARRSGLLVAGFALRLVVRLFAAAATMTARPLRLR